MESNKNRYLYIDNLRLLMIIFVVIMHLAVTFSGFGSWYYKEGKPIGVISMILFGFYQSFTQGYFMGFLFLISGYFTPGAYKRKGFLRFIKDRSIRLGIPALIYMLIINPFISYVILADNNTNSKQSIISLYTSYILNLKFISGSGPLWFAFALLIFSLIYAIVCYINDLTFKVSCRELTFKFKNAIYLVLLIAICAFLIRLIQPIGTSILNMQLCYFSQYIILFIIGILAYKNNLFSIIDYKAGRKWFYFGFLIGLVSWIIIMVLGGVIEGNQNYNGGFSWQAVSYAIWESFVAVSMSIGLICLFREKLNFQGKLIKTLSNNSFAVYVFHAPIITAASLLIKTLTLLPIIKWLILCIVCIPICFIFTHFIIRKIPLLKQVM